MSKLTVQQVIDEGMARGAAYVVVTAEVWGGAHASNSCVRISAGGTIYYGKSLESAFSQYTAQFTIGTPIQETATEIAATLEGASK